MTYTIEIAGMEFRARHGCYEVEQRVGGNFTVDISLTVNDLNDAAAKDDIEKTVNLFF